MEREILAGLITLSTGTLVSFIFEFLQQWSRRCNALSVEWKRMAVLIASTWAVLLNIIIGVRMPFSGNTYSAAMLNTFVVTAVAFAVYHLIIEKRIVVKLIDFSDLKRDPEPEEEEILPTILYNGELYFPPGEIIETEDS